MRRFLVIIFYNLAILSFSYGMIAQDIGGNMQQRITNFYCPNGTVFVVHSITTDLVKSESDNLYISIDDFLKEDKKLKNEELCAAFMGKYASLFITDKDIRTLLIEEILPDFKIFVEQDAACELMGFYSRDNVAAYLEYLRVRLNFLILLSSFSF